MIRFVLLLCGWLAAAPAMAADTVTVLVVGDSLSAAYGIDRDDGWVALLEERLADTGREVRVVNASITGDTTRGGRTRLPDALSRHEPDVVVIELGGNDGLRGIPLAETRRNLAAMVEDARAAGARVLLVGVRLPSNYGAAFIERFQQVFHDVASEYDVPLVPKFLAGVGGDPSLMQDDGIHPNAAAQPKLLDNLWPKLQPLLPEAAAGSGERVAKQEEAE